jgi:imidazolonepropionase-like amidohydrolase
MKASMQMIAQSGLHFGVGTDGLHGGLADDLLCLQDLGAPSTEILKAATIYGAEICGIDSVTGSLEQSKEADLIAVEGNPLQDVSCLKIIRAVVHRGIVFEEPGRSTLTTL